MQHLEPLNATIVDSLIDAFLGLRAGSGPRIVLYPTPHGVKHEALEVLVTAIDATYVLIIMSGAVLIVCSMFMECERITMQLQAGG